MKKTAVALVFGALLTLASPALANQIQVGYSGSPYGPYQSGQGGEFTLNDVAPPSSSWLDLSGYMNGVTSNFGPAGITSFQTFCVEVTEHIYPYSATYEAQLNSSAMYGSTGIGDELSQGTGWLYSQFATGGLTDSLLGAGNGYAYGGTEAEREASAYLLQQAFWWLEGEGVAFNASNQFMVAVVAQFGAQAQSGSAATYGVQAINLWELGHVNQQGYQVQDQLYYNPANISTTSVPDGGMTMSLLGIAMAGLGFVARRRK